ncbi:hypothetical protein NGUA41_00509 [Salmonella enterica]|nr:hypothetical protein NGUA41_00509 [Salmonella enterica]
MPNNRISLAIEPTRLLSISYAVFCLKKKNNADGVFHIDPVDGNRNSTQFLSKPFYRRSLSDTRPDVDP